MGFVVKMTAITGFTLFLTTTSYDLKDVFNMNLLKICRLSMKRNVWDFYFFTLKLLRGKVKDTVGSQKVSVYQS